MSNINKQNTYKLLLIAASGVNTAPGIGAGGGADGFVKTELFNVLVVGGIAGPFAGNNEVVIGAIVAGIRKGAAPINTVGVAVVVGFTNGIVVAGNEALNNGAEAGGFETGLFAKTGATGTAVIGVVAFGTFGSIKSELGNVFGSMAGPCGLVKTLLIK